MGIKVKQRDITDCGAACLASVSNNYNLKVPVARIRQIAGTDKKGTNITGMLAAAQKLGFDTKAARGPFESLFKIPKPAIAHVINKDMQHFVVIYKTTNKFIEIMDPADGQMHRLTHDEFKKQWTGVILLLLPGESFEERNEKIPLRSRFWNVIKPHKDILVQALFGSIIYTILGLSTSIYVQKLIDFVLVDGNRNLLNLMSIGMIVLLVLQVFISVAKSIYTIKTGQIIDAKLILGYYKHLLKLPQDFFDTMRVGEIVSRINDAVKIRIFLNDVSINFLVNIFIVIFSFMMMFTYYWKLGLVMLIVIPLYSLIYYVTNKINKKAQRSLMENAAELESQLVESLNAMGTIKRFGLEDHANEKTEKSFVSLLKVVYTSSLNSVFSGMSAEFVSRLITIILLWLGAQYVLLHEITPGELLSFYTLISYFTGPVSSLISMNKTIQDAVIASDRLFEIMDLEQESEQNQFTLDEKQLGDFTFNDVCFRYGTRAKIFDKLNLTIPIGKFTAIVGESGSGKSTLLSLLQNIYPIQEGSIMLGKYNLKYVSKSSLSSLISVVPQKIDLFAGNVIDNIAIGDYEPNMQKIIDISEQLGILKFIEELPNGFKTYLGENGATLSGGQKQRIAIARALYRDPEILILDEATSSLDSLSEIYIKNTINYLLSKNKTIIIIAHRLSTVFKADKIVVLENGKVVEEGVHQALMRTESHYFHLWQQQYAFTSD